MQATTTDITMFLITTSIIMLLLMSFIITMIFLYQKRQIRYYEAFNQLKCSHETTLLKAKIEVQEQTFATLSQEIHDNISLSLTLAKLQLNTMGEIPERLIPIIDNVKCSMTTAIDDLRDISRSLSPKVISEQGLHCALQNEIERILSSTDLKIEYSVIGNSSYLDAGKELIIFRVVQEAFNNILKHSNAKKAILTVNYTEEDIKVNISDDGVGFQQDVARKKADSSGIYNMEKRIMSCNGSINIESSPYSGTTVSLSIPY